MRQRDTSGPQALGAGPLDPRSDTAVPRRGRRQVRLDITVAARRMAG